MDTISQPTTMMFINSDLGNVVLGDTFPLELERVLYMDDNGIIREGYQDICSSVILSQNIQDEDDVETPPHVLDHMYAKKPREPGSEHTSAKTRRKSKRKEQIVEQYVIPDPPPQTPKINIIRQHLPRPKILQGVQPVNKAGRGRGVVLVNSSKGKLTSSRKETGRSNHIKKEDPYQGMYCMPFDEISSKSTQKTGRCGKDSLNKSFKSYATKSNAANNSTIMMEELQSRPDGATGYEEEMLFDFGIAEDDDEVNGLGSEEFSDVVFDECEFETGLEVYNTSLSRSPAASSIQLNQRSSSIKTTLNINSVQSSDEDEADQIMVSMMQRRRSSQDSIEDNQDKTNLEISEDSNASLSQSLLHVENTSKIQTCIAVTRRSKRATKAPSWLDDSSTDCTGKRKRR